ncbi:MAG: 50S ribosomal protein L35 [Armatimonadetes bacterium]|nr:50S ribosomal protein L35 [Armatimonadota bacterium]
MPKMKTRKGAAKRFKVTATGRVLHKPTGMSHLRSGKTRKRKRRLKIADTLKVGYERKIERLLPYGV